MSTEATRLLRAKIPGPETGIEVKKSICTICDPGTQCGLDLYVKDGHIVKVQGSKENPHSGGTLCSKGAAMRQYVYHKDRLRTPLRRVGPRGSTEFLPISWDEALDTIAARLNEAKATAGPESVAFYAGYTKWMRPFLHRLAGAFGSPNYLTESSTCHRAMVMAQNLVFGLPGRPDWASARCLLIWSANPFYTNTTLARRLLDARERGLVVITVDPRLTPTAAHSDLHLQLRPGTDGALALAMANVIIEEALYDRDFVDRHVHGFEEFQTYVREFTPERGEALTGVPADVIRTAARLYATSRPAALMPSASPVVHQTNGVQNYRAVFALVALTGNYDVRGGNFVEPPSWLYVVGGFPTREPEFCHPRPNDQMAPPIGHDRYPLWSELVDEAQAMHWPHQIHSGRPYPLKAALCFGLNYRMWPDPAHMAAALDKLDFVANVDLFMTDSCRFADIVLPACTSVERSEFRCYPERWAILTQPAIAPLYESRSDADIIYDLAQRLGLDDPLFAAGYEAGLDWILAPSGLTVAELAAHPAGMPVPRPLALPARKYLEDGFRTPSGKVELVSSLLARFADSHGYDALPTYRPPRHSAEATPDLAADFPLVLNTGSRLPMFIHSRTFRLRWTRVLRPEPAADLSPADAARLGIATGDPIKLSTPKGAIEVKANVTATVQPGVVHMYHAYPEADVNGLMEADYLDPISGFPGFKGLLCRVERVVA
ncbi:MAG: molybdopterin-dependent oxidoreductase [Thermoleophilia bacterium]